MELALILLNSLAETLLEFGMLCDSSGFVDLYCSLLLLLLLLLLLRCGHQLCHLVLILLYLAL